MHRGKLEGLDNLDHYAMTIQSGHPNKAGKTVNLDQPFLTLVVTPNLSWEFMTNTKVIV